nr:twin-arginine translocase subunit TatB [Acinetobacter sp.]
MLNLGMTEIFCFAVIALLVLGPDKLPEAARFVAKWYGKIKKFINNIQNEIDRELKLSEFREEMQKEIEKITELERRLQKQLDELKTQPSEQISTETLE